MSVEVVTKDDLQAFRLQLINDLKAILASKQEVKKEWLRSSEVRKLQKYHLVRCKVYEYRAS